MNLLSLPQSAHDPTNYSQSEGEEYLYDFFEEVGIEFQSETEITALKGDCKQYRKADFFLPGFKIYVEFFGMRSMAAREEYGFKREVYKLNKIPCIYIYPENLGIIKYIFDKRIQVELFRNGMFKELQRYRFFKLKNSGEFQIRVAGVLFCLFLLISKGALKDHNNISEYIMLSVVLLAGIYQLFKLLKLYHRIFRKNKFTLDKIDE